MTIDPDDPPSAVNTALLQIARQIEMRNDQAHKAEDAAGKAASSLIQAINKLSDEMTLICGYLESIKTNVDEIKSELRPPPTRRYSGPRRRPRRRRTP
jgi:hypothetical protein